MGRAWVCANSGRAGNRVEDRPAADAGGGSPLMDYYMFAGVAAVGITAGLIGLRLAKDEMLLRRKKVPA